MRSASEAAGGVLWDLDGTLIDSAGHHWVAWRDTLAAAGRSVTEAQFAQTFGKRNDEILRDLFGDGLDPAWVEEISDSKERAYRRILREQGLDLLPGAEAWLVRLGARGWKQALASSAPPKNIEAAFEALRLDRFLRTIVSADEVGRGKPDPAIFLEAGASHRRCGRALRGRRGRASGARGSATRGDAVDRRPLRSPAAARGRSRGVVPRISARRRVRRPPPAALSGRRPPTAGTPFARADGEVRMTLSDPAVSALPSPSAGPSGDVALAAALAGVSSAFASLGRVFFCVDSSFHVLHASSHLDRLLGDGAASRAESRPLSDLLGSELFGPGGTLRQLLLAGERREGWRSMLEVPGTSARLVSVTAAPFCPEPGAVCDPRVAFVIVLRPAEEDSLSTGLFLPRSHRPVGEVPAHLQAHREPRAQRGDRPPHRRERHRQGGRRARDPRALAAPRRAVRRRQLRRASRRAARERAVRPRAGRVHRRGARPRGALRGGRGGHALPRRDRRPARCTCR